MLSLRRNWGQFYDKFCVLVRRAGGNHLFADLKFDQEQVDQIGLNHFLVPKQDADARSG